MKIKLTSFLSILSTGAGCVIGIPIGINTVTEKCEPLTWAQMLEKWEDSWKEINVRIQDTEVAREFHEEKETQRIKKVQEESERIKSSEKLEEKRDESNRLSYERYQRLGLTMTGNLQNLQRRKEARQKRLQELKERTERLTQRTTWEERKEQIAKEFDEKIKELKNLEKYCGSNCTEDLKKKINEAKDRVAKRLKWMSEG